MCLQRLDKIIFALGLLFLMSNSIAKSKDYNLVIQNKSSIDLCSNKKEVIIAPYMGQILKSDNLIGFEMSINYDPEVVVMNRPLFIGTVSNYFEYKSIETDVQRGEIVFDGSSKINGSSVAVAADLPLFAIAGDFIGDCDDEVLFTINYIFFPEFKGEIEIQEGLVLKGNIVDKPTREIGYKIESTDRKIKKDSSLKVEVELKLGELTSLEYWKSKITVDTDSVSIDNITGTSNVEILDMTKDDDNGYLIEYKVLGTDNTKLFIETKSHKVDSAIINISIETIETTECICATRFPSSNFSITNQETKLQDTTTISSIVNTYSDKFEFINGNIIPTTEPIDIELYNINGMLIEKKSCNVNERYNTKQDRLGVYFIKVTSKEITRIIKIINN